MHGGRTAPQKKVDPDPRFLTRGAAKEWDPVLPGSQPRDHALPAMFGGERGAVLAITVDGREACRAEPVAKFRKGVHAAGRWLLAHRAVTEDGPGGNAAAGQRIQSLPVDHQVAVVLDDVGRLEIDRKSVV